MSVRIIRRAQFCLAIVASLYAMAWCQDRNKSLRTQGAAHHELSHLTIVDGQSELKDLSELDRERVVGVYLRQHDICLAEITSLRAFPNLCILECGDHPDDVEIEPQALAAIGDLASIEELRLFITGTLPDEVAALKGMSGLKCLEISADKLCRVEALQAIRALISLEVLALQSRCRIDDTGWISSLTNLRSLELSGTLLDRGWIDGVKGMQHLKKLSVHGAALSADDVRTLADDTNNKLEYLHFCVNTGVALVELGRHKGLHILSVNCTSDCDAALSFIEQCEQLETVWLRGMSVSEFDVSKFERHPTLSHIEVTDAFGLNVEHEWSRQTQSK
jgi:hypothetical protein